MPSFKAFFTDGAYSPLRPTAKDILTPESSLRDQGIGAGGIVFVPSDASAPPLMIRITSSHPEPGMNAYTWELVTQLVALHLAKFLPPSVTGHSDCLSALARTNRALRSKNDQLATTNAGLYGAALHALANIDNARQMEWIKGHPETDPTRNDLSNPLDKGIFMADAVAEGGYRSLTGRGIPSNITTINLSNILNEIIPIGQWHVRSHLGHQAPILDDILTHCHAERLESYLRTRDTGKIVKKWTTTKLEFTNKIHPLPYSSSWTAARRATIIFDWLGHGRNMAKMTPSLQDRESVSKCTHCAAPDSQSHCMLDCPHLPFTEIRTQARRDQSIAATTMLKGNAHLNSHHKHFIQQLCHACWMPDNPQLDRLWLGTWNTATLTPLLTRECPLDHPVSSTSRHQYIKVAKLLTAPLLVAYHAMINMSIAKRDRLQGSDDYTPPTESCNRTHSSPTSHSSQQIQLGLSSLELRYEECDTFSYIEHLELASMHPQMESESTDLLLLSTDRVLTHTPFTISDSAMRLAESYDT